MSMNIKNEETHRLAQELAALTGQSVNWRIKLPDFWRIVWQNLANYLAICFFKSPNSVSQKSYQF